MAIISVESAGDGMGVWLSAGFLLALVGLSRVPAALFLPTGGPPTAPSHPYPAQQLSHLPTGCCLLPLRAQLMEVQWPSAIILPDLVLLRYQSFCFSLPAFPRQFRLRYLMLS